MDQIEIKLNFTMNVAVPVEDIKKILRGKRKLKLIWDSPIDVLFKKWEEREVEPGALGIKTLQKYGNEFPFRCHFCQTSSLVEIVAFFKGL